MLHAVIDAFQKVIEKSLLPTERFFAIKRLPFLAAMHRVVLLGAAHRIPLSLNRRLAQDFEFAVNYTFSKAIDDASDFSEQPRNPYNLRADRGVSLYDQKHRLVINGTFDLPIGDEDAPGTRQGLLTRIFKNIELAPIVTVQSGEPPYRTRFEREPALAVLSASYRFR